LHVVVAGPRLAHEHGDETISAARRPNEEEDMHPARTHSRLDLPDREALIPLPPRYGFDGVDVPTFDIDVDEDDDRDMERCYGCGAARMRAEGMDLGLAWFCASCTEDIQDRDLDAHDLGEGD
jgi:hypothetical protein